MTRLKTILTRFVQIIFFVFFTYVGFIFLGMLLLVPLAIFLHVYHLFHAIGFSGLLAGMVAAAGTGVLGYIVYQMPDLVNVIKETGLKLLDVATNQNRKFGELATSSKGE